jgi:hypothetical protein
MKMPHFTAEESLFRTNRPYRMDGGQNAFVDGQRVTPQRAVCRVFDAEECENIFDIRHADYGCMVCTRR